MKKILSKLQTAINRYPLVVFALILGSGAVALSMAFVAKVNQNTGSAAGTIFDTSRVVPQPVSIPAKSLSNTTAYSAETIKQYNGQDGHQCYVAVKGTVYEIKDSAYWKGGKHAPSGGQGYCGADMTEVIGKSTHGEQILSSLPKVGVFE